MQFWDPNHLVAQELNRRTIATPPEVKPACCVSRGLYWDDAILYAQRTRWSDEAPASFWNGPLVRVIPALEAALRNTK
jgi:hypothetical protein